MRAVYLVLVQTSKKKIVFSMRIGAPHSAWYVRSYFTLINLFYIP